MSPVMFQQGLPSQISKQITSALENYTFSFPSKQLNSVKNSGRKTISQTNKRLDDHNTALPLLPHLNVQSPTSLSFHSQHFNAEPAHIFSSPSPSLEQQKTGEVVNQQNYQKMSINFKSPALNTSDEELIKIKTEKTGDQIRKLPSCERGTLDANELGYRAKNGLGKGIKVNGDRSKTQEKGTFQKEALVRLSLSASAYAQQLVYQQTKNAIKQCNGKQSQNNSQYGLKQNFEGSKPNRNLSSSSSKLSVSARFPKNKSRGHSAKHHSAKSHVSDLNKSRSQSKLRNANELRKGTLNETPVKRRQSQNLKNMYFGHDSQQKLADIQNNPQLSARENIEEKQILVENPQLSSHQNLQSSQRNREGNFFTASSSQQKRFVLTGNSQRKSSTLDQNGIEKPRVSGYGSTKNSERSKNLLDLHKNTMYITQMKCQQRQQTQTEPLVKKSGPQKIPILQQQSKQKQKMQPKLSNQEPVQQSALGFNLLPRDQPQAQPPQEPLSEAQKSQFQTYVDTQTNITYKKIPIKLLTPIEINGKQCLLAHLQTQDADGKEQQQFYILQPRSFEKDQSQPQKQADSQRKASESGVRNVNFNWGRNNKRELSVQPSKNGQGNQKSAVGTSGFQIMQLAPQNRHQLLMNQISQIQQTKSNNVQQPMIQGSAIKQQQVNVPQRYGMGFIVQAGNEFLQNQMQSMNGYICYSLNNQTQQTSFANAPQPNPNEDLNPLRARYRTQHSLKRNVGKPQNSSQEKSAPKKVESSTPPTDANTADKANALQKRIPRPFTKQTSNATSPKNRFETKPILTSQNSSQNAVSTSANTNANQNQKEREPMVKKYTNEIYTQQKLKSLTWIADRNQDPAWWKMTDEEQQLQDRLAAQKEIKAKYNMVSMNKAEPELYKWICLRGNNHELVKRVMETRPSWAKINPSSTIFHFKWSPVSRGIKFEFMSKYGQKNVVNHFEHHSSMTTKDQLFNNVSKLSDSVHLDIFSFLPVTFILDYSSINYKQDFDKFCNYFNVIEKFKAKENESLESLNAALLSHPKLVETKKNFKKKIIHDSYFDGINLWLLKPPDCNRGRGVHLFSSIDQLKFLMTEMMQGNVPLPTQKPEASKTEEKETEQTTTPTVGPKSEVFVIQKYLEKPLLIDKRKFDIRLWVLVTQDHKCFLYKEGYIRMSGYKFALDQEDRAIHLTNNAIQKHDPNYGHHEEGNILSFKKASESLAEEGIEIDFHEKLEKEIKPIVTQTLIATRHKLNKNNRRCCFEIFGYDFIIDQNLTPWLIEVNTNPCLEESSQMLSKLIHRMIDDTFKLTIDKEFPPLPFVEKPAKEGSQFPLDEHGDENLWGEAFYEFRTLQLQS